jgi:hypothetical protein
VSDPFDVERVIAALDACSDDLEILAAAVDVAARLQTAVAGLFIEDESLLRLWSLPAARHVTLGRAARDLPSAEQIEADLKARAAQAEAALEAAARRQRVPWSFRVVRGRTARELDAATMNDDLLMVGWTPALPGLPIRLGSPLEEAARELARSTVHVPRRGTMARPVAVVRAGSPLVNRVLAAAMRLAGPQTGDLDVVLSGAAPDILRATPEITSRLLSRGYRARIRGLDDVRVPDLMRMLAEIGADSVVAAADVPLFGEQDGVHKALERAGLSVMIVH